MEKKSKTKIVISVLFLFCLLNSFLVAFSTNSIDNNAGEVESVDTDIYSCYWWAEDLWNGPWTRDCSSCVYRPMTNPSTANSCTLY